MTFNSTLYVKENPVEHLLKLLIPIIFIYSSGAYSSEKQSYFFDKTPYVHPAIIEDLSSWISDRGDQVVSINIDDSNESNRYFGTYETTATEKENEYMYHNSGNPYISISRKNACKSNSNQRSPEFGYELIGKINDVYVLHTSESSCGTGVWHNLMFVKLETSLGLSYLGEEGKLIYNNKRNIIIKLHELPIGDRYEGYIKIEENKIYLSKGSRKSSIITKDTIIELNENI